LIAGLTDPAVTCQDPVPGTWCAPDCQGAEGGDRDVLLLR
jgi:hypothetical protein